MPLARAARNRRAGVAKRENWIDTLTLGGKSLQIGGPQPPRPTLIGGRHLIDNARFPRSFRSHWRPVRSLGPPFPARRLCGSYPGNETLVWAGARPKPFAFLALGPCQSFLNSGFSTSLSSSARSSVSPWRASAVRCYGFHAPRCRAASAIVAVAPANENRTVALPRAKAKSVPGVAAVPVSPRNRRQNLWLSPRSSRRSAT